MKFEDDDRSCSNMIAIDFVTYSKEVYLCRLHVADAFIASLHSQLNQLNQRQEKKNGKRRKTKVRRKLRLRLRQGGVMGDGQHMSDVVG